jgi:hypothetical protein
LSANAREFQHATPLPLAAGGAGVNWFVEIVAPSAFNAGTKAFDDVNDVLRKRGFQPVILDRRRPFLRRLVQAPVSLVRLASKLIDPRNTIVIQAPLPVEAKAFVRELMRVKRATVVVLVHDLDSMRYTDRSHESAPELTFLKLADAVICHNASMARWLQERGIRQTLTSLTFFDYLIEEQTAPDASFVDVSTLHWRRDIVFAGNLSKLKSGFLYELSDDYEVTLRAFGSQPPPDSTFPKCVRYCGRFPPERPSLPPGLFGLVWDGTDIGSCTGISGTYLKLNSPHKVSLYLACGLPVICWRQSALAAEIESRNLGFAIDSLEEIPRALRELPDATYAAMLARVDQVRTKIREGKQLLEALDHAILDVRHRTCEALG